MKLFLDTVQIEEFSISITRKKIKSLILKIRGEGEIKISAPLKQSDVSIRNFIIRKLPWIRNILKNKTFHQKETPKEFIDGEIHSLFGMKLPLRVLENSKANSVFLGTDQIILSIKKNASLQKRQLLMDLFYKEQLILILKPMIETWEKKMKIKVQEFFIKKMKTRWGTCNPSKKRIWFSFELSKKSIVCIEYIVVHELIHFFELGHNKRFYALMDYHLPNWKIVKTELNSN